MSIYIVRPKSIFAARSVELISGRFAAASRPAQVMATPIVSGVAALILEKYPDITVTDLVEELLFTCKDLRQPADRQGKGLVQVKAAV